MRARITPSRPAPIQPRAIPDGITDLAAGKIAAVATYLEMRRPSAPPPPEPLPGLLAPLGHDLARYRALYAAIGEPWLWFSRALMPDEKLAQILSHPDVMPLAWVEDGRDVALLELDFRSAPDCELAFFGLVPGHTGRGLGPALLAEAVRLAFARPIARLWLHTCTLDHPAALPAYLKAGFTPYRRAIEVEDDPRLTGRMPKGAAPWFPIV